MAELKSFVYEICIPFIVFLCALAALLNIAVFLSRWHVKSRRSIMDFSRSTSLELTYSLALSDTWTSIVVAVSLFWNSYKPVVLDIKHSSFCFPLTLEAFRTGGLLTGIFHLVALAFVHYIQISRPFDHQKLLPLRLVQGIIALIWIGPPVCLILYFGSWEGQGYRSENCAVGTFYFTLPFRATISVIIMVMIVTTSVLYQQMLLIVSEVRSKTASATNARGRRTVITAALIFGTFLFGWMPASIVFILTADGMPLRGIDGNMIHIISTVVLLTIMIKTLTNPIIYATRIPEIRHFVLHKLLWNIFPVQEEQRQKSETMPLRHSTLTRSAM